METDPGASRNSIDYTINDKTNNKINKCSDKMDTTLDDPPSQERPERNAQHPGDCADALQNPHAQIPELRQESSSFSGAEHNGKTLMLGV